eukprot:Em0201g15a
MLLPESRQKLSVQVKTVIKLVVSRPQTHYPCRVSGLHGSVPKAQPEGKSLVSELVVFVGGCPRSGTTLARAMLDAHPDIRCGEETRVLPRILAIASKMSQSTLEQKRLESGGVSEELLDRAIAAFMGEIIVGHGVPSKYLCNKDPLLLQHMKHIARMFPKAKFLLMIRDGRAVAHSIVSRNITISGVDAKNYLSAALFWNKVALSMSEDCNNLPRAVHDCVLREAGGRPFHADEGGASLLRHPLAR